MPTNLSNTDLQELKANIEARLEEWSVDHYKQEPRAHLGISEIGEPCSRKLWYKFHWVAFEEFSGRMLRLFNRGHREEERYISYLEAIGCTFYRFDQNGKQFRVSGVMGHYGGSCDGVVLTPWHPDIPFIAEFKTHNTKSFIGYINDGLQKSKPRHFDQMSGYGFKMQIEYGLYFPENKNDDDIQVTPIKLDWQRGKELELKAQDIITAKEAPAKISDQSSYFECKYCTFKDICHNGAIPQKNCRSCRMSEAVEDGRWYCNVHKDLIPPEFIKNGCQYWSPV